MIGARSRRDFSPFKFCLHPSSILLNSEELMKGERRFFPKNLVLTDNNCKFAAEILAYFL